MHRQILQEEERSSRLSWGTVRTVRTANGVRQMIVNVYFCLINRYSYLSRIWTAKEVLINASQSRVGGLISLSSHRLEYACVRRALC